MSTSDKIINFDNLIASLNTIIFGGDTDVSLNGVTKPTITKFLLSIAARGWSEEPFLTELGLLNSIPSKSKTVAKALDTKKVWLWDNETWSDTGVGDLDLAKEFSKMLTLESETGIQSIYQSLQILSDSLKNLDVREELESDIESIRDELLYAANLCQHGISSVVSDMGTKIVVRDEDYEKDKLYALYSLLHSMSSLKNATGSHGDAKITETIYQVPEPKGLVKIYLTSEGSIPNAKTDGKVKGVVKFNVDGQGFELDCTFAVQGSSSAGLAKKNLTFAFYKDSELSDSVEVQIGDLLPHDELIFKANVIDHTHFRNIGSNMIWDDFLMSRDTLPFRDVDLALDGMSNPDNVEAQPIGHVMGYPCVVYFNGGFYGIGSINIGKKRGNYRIPKNVETKILMEMGHWCSMRSLDFVGTGWNGEPIVEVKAPSKVTATTKALFTEWGVWTNMPFAEFKTKMDTYINRRNLVDFMIFVDLILANDLVGSDLGKNFILTSYNGKQWLFNPYDLDTCFGLQFNGDVGAAWDLSLFDRNNEVLFFSKVYKALKPEMDLRYADLRRKDVVSVKNVYNTLTGILKKYPKNLIVLEQQKWNGVLPSLPNTSITQILTWTEKRIGFLDGIYNYTS